MVDPTRRSDPAAKDPPDKLEYCCDTLGWVTRAIAFDHQWDTSRPPEDRPSYERSAYVSQDDPAIVRALAGDMSESLRDYVRFLEADPVYSPDSARLKLRDAIEAIGRPLTEREQVAATLTQAQPERS